MGTVYNLWILHRPCVLQLFLIEQMALIKDGKNVNFVKFACLCVHLYTYRYTHTQVSVGNSCYWLHSSTKEQNLA